MLLWQRPKSTGTDGGFEKGAAVGCGGLSPYSARYLSAPGLMRLTAMPALLELCGLAGSERQLRAESWFGRLAGGVSQSQPSQGLHACVGNLAREGDRVPGKSRCRDIELVGLHARELQWLGRGLGGRECAVWLRGRLD